MPVPLAAGAAEAQYLHSPVQPHMGPAQPYWGRAPAAAAATGHGGPSTSAVATHLPEAGAGRVGEPAEQAEQAEHAGQAHLPVHLRSARRVPACPKFARLFGPDFFVVDTFGRGSCFFHAIAQALYEGYDWIEDSRAREAVGLRLRQSFVKYSNEQLYLDAMDQMRRRIAHMQQLRPNAPRMPEIPSYAVFERSLGTPSVWADLVLISFIGLKFHLNLVFFDDVKCALYYGASRFDAAQDVRTIFINWHNHRHFELIVQIDEARGIVKRQFTYPEDAGLLERVMRSYNGEDADA
jgi:hypothetical protein